MGKPNPEKLKKMGIREKHLFIEEHKDEIIRDARKLKKSEVLKKWGIASVTFYKLRNASGKSSVFSASLWRISSGAYMSAILFY